MGRYAVKQKNSILIGLIVGFLFFSLLLPMSVFAQDETYGWQGIGNTETGDINLLLMIDPDPSDITVIHTAKDKNDEYINKINTPIKASNGMRITFTMKAGMGSFNSDGFRTNCMPYINIWDEEEEKIVASAENGLLQFYENESHGKSDSPDYPYGKIVIGTEEDALDAGDYVLVFGSEVCGNNTAKILGVPVKFQFSLNVVPELDELIDSIQSFLKDVELYDTQNVTDEEQTWGKYPEEKAAELEEAVVVAKNENDKEAAAEILNEKFKEFKASVAVGILSLEVDDFSNHVQVGDTGIAKATVVSVPENKKNQTVHWSILDGNGCIDINENTGEWTANYPGNAVIRATTTKGTFSQKYQDIRIEVETPKDGFASVNVSKSGTLHEIVKNANLDQSDIKALRISTSEGIKLSESDLTYIKSLDKLEQLDVFYANSDHWKLDGMETLKSVVLSKTMETLECGAFEGCVNLEQIEIPASVSSIDCRAFTGCLSLPECITIRSVIPPQYIGTKSNVVFDGTTVTSIKVPYGCVNAYSESDPWKNFTIHQSDERTLVVEDVNSTDLETKAKEQLKKLQLDESEIDTLVIVTGKNQWLDRMSDILWIQNNCLNATTIDISQANLEDSKVKANYFKDRVNLKAVRLPNNITNLANNSFSGCTNLQEIELPSCLASIGNNAFQDCISLPETMICNAKVPPEFNGALPLQIKAIRVPTSSIDLYKRQVGWSQYEILGQIEATFDQTAITLEVTESANIQAHVKTYGNYSNQVQWKSDNNDIVIVKGMNETATIQAIKAGTAVITLCDISGNELAKCSITVKSIPAPQNVKVTQAAYNKLKISWSAVNGVDKYVVYRCNSKGKTVKSWTLKSTTRTFTDNGLATGTTYYYKVRAYRTVSGVNYYSQYSSLKSGKPVLGKVTKVKVVKGGTKKAKVSWSKVTGASGYVVYRSTKKTSGFKAIKTVKGNKTIKYTTGTMKKGKTYYFKVKAYRTVGSKKVYSPSYSSVVKYKVK